MDGGEFYISASPEVASPNLTTTAYPPTLNVVSPHNTAYQVIREVSVGLLRSQFEFL